MSTNTVKDISRMYRSAWDSRSKNNKSCSFHSLHKPNIGQQVLFTDQQVLKLVNLKSILDQKVQSNLELEERVSELKERAQKYQKDEIKEGEEIQLVQQMEVEVVEELAE